MTDLYVALCLIASLSAAALWAARSLSKVIPGWACDVLACLIVVATLLFAQSVWYRVTLVSLFPTSSLIVLGNWFPVLAYHPKVLKFRQDTSSSKMGFRMSFNCAVVECI